MDRRAETAAKLELARSWLERHQGEGLLLASQANFAWATAGGHNHVALGGSEGVASVLVTAHEAYLCTNNIEHERILTEEAGQLPFTSLQWPWHQPELALEGINQVCSTERVVSDLGSFGLALAAADLAELRHTLLPPEVERYRRLGADAAEALETAARQVEPGSRELDVAAQLAFECRKRDILDLVNLVAADERIAHYRHPLPTPAPVSGMVIVVLTGRRHGLHASLTRMVSLGAADSEVVTRHHAVTRVDAREILESRPGVALSGVMLAGAQQYGAEGFPDEWRLHHQGGLTGYAGREVFATPDSHYRLRAGQALAWNPSITRVKSEDTVLLTDDGHEVLTRTGSWPENEVTLPVGTMPRPAILEAG